VTNLISRIGCVLLGLLGAGCSSAFLQTEVVPEAPVANVQPNAQGHASGPLLYAGDLFDQISQYRLGSSKPVRSIQAVTQAYALATDSLGNLFAANGQVDYGEVDVYSAENLGLLRRIQYLSSPVSLATDRHNYLYIANDSGILVYAPGGTKLVHVMRRGTACALAFDQAGDLYAANGNGRSVGVYGPTKTPGQMKFKDNITDGVKFPYTLTISSSGDLFVANWGRSAHSKSGNRRDSVSVYSLKNLSLERVITDGILRPFALAVDSAGRLYVGNHPLGRRQRPPPGWVSVYSAGSTRPLRKITQGIDWPVSLAVDSSDDLYVADQNGNAITVYGSAGAKLVRTITRDVRGPESLLIASP